MLTSTLRPSLRGIFIVRGVKVLTFLLIVSSLLVAAQATAAPYRVLGQPTLASTTLASRCASANARFSFSTAGGFNMYGPSGIAVDPRGRIYVTDFGGRRVLTWPNANALQTCQMAESVIGANDLSGPEAVAIDFRSRTATVFVADTLNHTVKAYQRTVVGTWVRTVTLGTPGIPGNAMNQFNFPRGLAFDANGRLFVADDFNKRILIFSPPFTNGKVASDSIGAFANGGFSSPKGLAMIGDTLFVADYYNNRVLRFTGPFTTPNQVYTATGVFTGLYHPIDLVVHPDGSLLVTDQGNRRMARYANAVWSESQSVPTGVFAEYMNPESFSF
jgi:DNA-binding beta-propeller fold protein YncE